MSCEDIKKIARRMRLLFGDIKTFQAKSEIAGIPIKKHFIIKRDTT